MQHTSVAWCITIILTLLFFIGNSFYFKFLTDIQNQMLDNDALGRIFKNNKNQFEKLRPSVPLFGDNCLITEDSGDDSWLKTNNTFKKSVYYSQWSVYERNFYPKDIPFDVITDVFYSFMKINDKGKVDYSDTFSDLEIESSYYVTDKKGKGEFFTHQITDYEIMTKGAIPQLMDMKKYFPYLTVSMSIGGWGASEGFTNLMKQDIYLDNFVESAVKMMLTNGFDGIDLDWEFPEDQQEAEFYIKILLRLKAQLQLKETELHKLRGSFKITVAAPCSEPHMRIFELIEMDKYVDFWNLMCYDFAGEWSEKSNYHSNLYSDSLSKNSADKGVSYFTSQGIHSRKLILGMPNYGRGFVKTQGRGSHFKGVGGGTSDECGIYNYEFLPLEDCVERFDDKLVSLYCYDEAKRFFISYDNVESATRKASYVFEKKLGGGMWWESCGDDYEDEDKSLVYNFLREIDRLLN